MSYTTIDDPSEYFHIQLYTGTGSSHSVTNDANAGDFKPDWVWIKERSSAGGNKTYDSSRGVQEALQTQSTAGEATTAQGLTAFNTDGFTVGSDGGHNQSSATYVAWQWKANGGTTSSNSDGDLTSTVQFNSTAKFSIILYTGKDPIEPLDIGHGMGEAPDVYIVKNRDRGANWGMYHKELTSPAENRNLKLNSSAAEAAESTFWRNEAPTSTIIKTGENASVNVANENFVVYAWKEVQGFSKFGKYIGNGASDAAPATNGPFIYTGFSPAWVMIKKISAVDDWLIFDNERDGFDPRVYRLFANDASGETTGTNNTIQFTSNGFKIRFHGGSMNTSGGEYIYMAFANSPFATSKGIPTTGR